jgi:hypothetical protein
LALKYLHVTRRVRRGERAPPESTHARLGVKATFFVAAGYLDGGRMFNDTMGETV